MKTKKMLFTLFFIFILSAITGQPLSDNNLKQKKIYMSIAEALLSPDSVYRLQLKGRLKCDSLPSDIFRLTHLQELSLSGAKISVLNSEIATLTNLTKLNLDNNNLVRLPESLCQLLHLRELIISRNIISSLPEKIGALKNLERIDAWGNPLYVLPDGITALKETLKILDLRQVALRDYEYEKMETLLPKTNIIITFACNCNSNREK